MPRLGLITNPHSRANKRDASLPSTLADALGDSGEVATPVGLQAIRDQLKAWKTDGLHTLAIHGGDGTTHRVVTALIEVWGEETLPRLAMLRGGTMNTIANSLGQRRATIPAIKRLVAQPDALPTLPTWTMRIEGSQGVHHGFLFGNGIIGRYLERYYDGGSPTPAKAVWILARGVSSALVGGAYARDLSRPFHGQVRVDDEDWGEGPWMSIAAGTVEQLGLGFRAFHLVPKNPGRLHAIGIGGTVLQLARDLPRAYRGLSFQQPGNRGVAAQRIEITSDERIGFMIDGDFHISDRNLVVSTGPCVQIVDLTG